MARRTAPPLWIDPARLGGDLASDAEESRYLTRVLRYGQR